MRNFQREFRIPWTHCYRVFMLANSLIGTYNSRKIGRNRRGELFLNGFDYKREGTDAVIRVDFRRVGCPYVSLPNGRLQVYRMTNHRKLIKVLTELSTQ